MADTHFPDEWLVHSLEGVLTPELLAELREKATPTATLWQTLVAQKIVSDEQILTALATRFRLRIANLQDMDPTAKERVPEQLARRYQIVPLQATDSYLEVATANPFDIDAVSSAGTLLIAGTQSPGTATRGGVVNGKGDSDSAAATRLPSNPGPGPGGSNGGSAAGSSSGSATSTPVTPVELLLQAAPAHGMCRSRLSQPSWRTSFFALIPERPD